MVARSVAARLPPASPSPLSALSASFHSWRWPPVATRAAFTLQRVAGLVRVIIESQRRAPNEAALGAFAPRPVRQPAFIPTSGRYPMRVLFRSQPEQSAVRVRGEVRFVHVLATADIYFIHGVGLSVSGSPGDPRPWGPWTALERTASAKTGRQTAGAVSISPAPMAASEGGKLSAA